MNSKFVGFLSRSAYQSLKLAGPLGTTENHQAETSDQASSKPSKILLITSLPNLSHLPTRQTFQQALLDYTKSFTSTSCPLVIIVPDAGSSGAAEESWIGSSGGNDAAWDLRTVLGKDLTVNPAVRVVEFVLGAWGSRSPY
jgi:cell cycle checkpoint protein